MKGLLTPLIAIIAVYIAYQQYRINKRKINLDLYEKRFKIYIVLKELLGKMMTDGKIDKKELVDIIYSINDSIFLFESDIPTYIEQIKNNAACLTDIADDLKDPTRFSSEVELQTAARRKTELGIWFNTEYTTLEKRFLRYLDFKKI